MTYVFTTPKNSQDLDAIVAVYVFNKEICYDQNNGFFLSYGESKGVLPSYSTNIALAWQIAQKFGIALVPQSDGDGFRWFACDISSVTYSGDEIKIEPKNDSGISAPTAPLAICLAALSSVGVEVDATALLAQ